MLENISFEKERFCELFPFYFAFDRELRLTSVGPSLEKLDVFTPGRSVLEILTFKRPVYQASYDKILEYSKSLHILRLNGSELTLRGQFVENKDSLIFLGSPWVSSWEQLKKSSLDLSDFGAADPVTDYLTLLHTSQRALSETQEVAEKLAQAQEETLSILASLPDRMFSLSSTNVAYLFNNQDKAWKEVDLLEYFPPAVAHRLRKNEIGFDLLSYQFDGREFEARTCFSDKGSSLILVREITGQRASEQRILQNLPHLEQSQKMEALGRMASGIAHDFNNILTAIMLNLAELSIADESREELRDIQDAAERAASLTRQLLTFSQNQVPQNKMLAMNAVLKDMARILPPLLRDQIELELRLDQNAGFVFMDQSQLEQVIFNLAINSKDAMTKGGKLTIGTKVAQRGHETYTKLSVSDTGIGMGPDTLKKIFEPFYSEKNSSGLGLATVYGIVNQAAGYIEVSSEIGVGTEFSVYLPRRLDTEANDKANAKLLIVDDEDAIRRILARKLKKSGYEVLQATDGLQALEIMEESGEQIDLIVTDVLMPGMSGPELIERLLPNRQKLRAIFISGNPDNLMSGRELLDRFPLLPKPFSASRLVELVELELQD